MPAAQAGKAAKVTLVVDDVPVVQVLQTLAEQERQNLVVSPDVSGTLSLHLTGCAVETGATDGGQ